MDVERKDKERRTVEGIHEKELQLNTEGGLR